MFWLWHITPTPPRPHPTNPAHLSVFLINTVCTDWLIAAVGDKQDSQNDIKMFLYSGHRSQYNLSGGNLSSHLNGCAKTLMLSVAPDSVCAWLSCLGQLRPLCWKTGAFCAAKRAKSVLRLNAVWPSSFDKHLLFFPVKSLATYYTYYTTYILYYILYGICIKQKLWNNSSKFYIL